MTLQLYVMWQCGHS